MTRTSPDRCRSRVLLCGDRAAQWRTLSAILQTEGLDVVTCATGAEALHQLANGGIDVAVVDIPLLNDGGRKLLDPLSDLSERIPLIISIGRDSHVDPRLTIKTSVFAYLEKDANPTEVVGHIHRAIQSRLRHRAEDMEAAMAASTRELRQANEALQRELAERVRAEEEREMAIEFLRLMNECKGTAQLIRGVTDFLRRKSGCEAVGIRFRREHDYPYYETRGFPTEFVLLENGLCSRNEAGRAILDECGNPVLECMCGNVISGRFDPSQPFFTAKGSYWTNSTTELLATSSEAERLARTRDRCNGEGYESVALIPLHVAQERLGLIQLNDKRKGRFTPEIITRWERLADYLAVALSKLEAEEALREKERRYHSTLDFMMEGCQIIGFDWQYLYVNDMAARHGRRAKKDLVGRTLMEVYPGIEKTEMFRCLIRCMKERKPHQMENEFTYSDNTKSWFDVRIRPTPEGLFILSIDITERMRAEIDLRRSESELAAIYDNAPLIMLLVDRRRCVVKLNQPALSMARRTAHECIGLRGGEALRCVHASDDPQGCGFGRTCEACGVRQTVCQAFESGRASRRVEASITHDQPDGPVELHLLVSAIPLTASGEDLVLVSLEDVTDQKIAARNLQTSERKFRVLAETVEDVFWMSPPGAGESLYVSPAYEEIWGRSRDEFRENPMAFLDSVHADDRERFRSVGRQYHAQGRAYECEYRIVRPDGEQRWILERGFPVLDAPPDCPIMAGVCTDITLRKRAQEWLQRSEEWFRSLIELSASVYSVIDADGNVCYESPSVEKWFGWKPAELVGHHALELIHPDDVLRAQQTLREVMEEPGKMAIQELRYRHKNGTWRWVRVIGVNRIDNPAVRGVVFTSQEITERKQAEVALRRAKDAAEAANRAKSEFLANMSHEIRTPMTAITGFTELLLAKERSLEEQHDYLTTIHRNAQHLLAIINDILDLSRIEADRVEVDLMDWSPRVVVEEVMTLFHQEAREKGLSLEVDFVDPLPESIRTDPGRLRQILVNLVGNAIKFTDAGRVRITVRAISGQRAGRQIQFEVTDTGIGICTDAMALVFEPFTQVDMSSTRRFGGTGLGLSISRRLAEMLGGRIEVASELGRGSTFRLTLDVGRTPAVGVAETPRDTFQLTSRAAWKAYRGRVLLAEDALDMSKLLQSIFNETGLHLDLAENGSVAYEKAMASQAVGQPYDLILMDIRMPVMDGHEATRRLRTSGWTGPIVALTANSMDTDRAKCLQAGCDDFLSKPVIQAELLDVIERYLRVSDEWVGSPLQLPDASHAVAANRLFDGLLDDVTVARLLHEYRQTLHAKVEALVQALAMHDFQSLARLAHELKGVAGMYGFAQVSEKARSLQQIAEQGNDLAKIEKALTELTGFCRAAAKSGGKLSAQTLAPTGDEPGQIPE